MTQAPEPIHPTAEQIKEGLTKVKQVLDVEQAVTNPALVDQARQAVSRQVARLSSTEAASVRWDQAKAKQIPGTYSYVWSPTGSDPEDLSGLTVLFNNDGQHVATVETVFTTVSPTVTRMRSWVNGKLAFDQSLDTSSTTSARVAPDGTMSPEFSWDVLNSCLSNAGIAWGTIALIGLACSVACIGTAGAGCVVCIAGLAGADGGVIGFCVGRAIAS